MPQLRPRYHFAPPGGWMNDPNGLVWHDGEYHLFYQFEPSLAGDSEVMHWGHAISRDLVRWTHLPVALEPDELGAIWSGSAVVDRGNTSGFFTSPGGGIVAVFTHHARSGAERQSLAFSADRGRSWTKFSHNPVLGDDQSREFRDPRVFWHAPTNRWVMVVGVRQRLYASDDLRRWTFLGETGFTSECPDLFPLPIENAGGTEWVLSLAGRHYVLGAFDGERFVAETAPRLVEGGIDFYAAQSWENEPAGRRIWIGWLNNWTYARELPDFGARGFLTIPRELALRRMGDGDLHLIQRPAAELASLRGVPITLDRPGRRPGLLEVSGDALEVEAVLAVHAGDRCGLKVHASPREETLIGCDGTTGSVFADRRRSGSPLLNDRHSTAVLPESGRVVLRIFIDRLSVETFVNDGDAVLTSLVYASPPATDVGWFSENGRSHLESLSVWPLTP